MGEPIRKTDIARSAFAAGDVKTALRIAKEFRIGIRPDESHAMKMAYECMVHPEFYSTLGINTKTKIDAGIEVLRRTVMR